MFPSVVKAGIGLGGEYGEGLLIIRGRPGGYYNIVSGSFGFQLGVQVRSVIIMFMTEAALASFSNTYGWKAGVDGSIAIVTLGAGGVDRHREPDEPGARLHPRSGGAHVQSDAGRLEDQPHHALSVSQIALCPPRSLKKFSDVWWARFALPTLHAEGNSPLLARRGSGGALLRRRALGRRTLRLRFLCLDAIGLRLASCRRSSRGRKCRRSTRA